MKRISFTLPLAPVAKGRPRFGQGRVYTPGATRLFEGHFIILANHHKPHEPWKGPIRLWVVFSVKKPRKPKHPVHPISKPDGDNFFKAVSDSMRTIFFVDDAQIVDMRAIKVYGPPQITVEVEELQ